MAMELLNARGTVTICNSKTKNVAEKVKQADIVVVGVGIPKMVKGDWVKDGAIVIDIGINRLEDGSLVGDVDFDAVKDIAGAITPVPGGVGPMTIATLLENTLIAYRQNL
jgi:methylenetetrahydrofolate dehydrogenase (NADP+)/methenyltetrahydrofolate cyclohydrolase